jgi:CDGSH-type Zn-finger protein
MGEQSQDKRSDGTPPTVNVVRVCEDGPLVLHADLAIDGQECCHRASLCRCGASRNKPFCDGSHKAAGFAATGEPATQDSPALEVRGGLLTVKPLRNGPLMIKGALQIVSDSGRTVTQGTEAFLCRCWASAKKPFCDGMHKKIGFAADGGSR